MHLIPYDIWIVVCCSYPIGRRSVMILAKVPIVQRGEEGRGVTDLLYIARYTQLSGSLGGRIRYLISTDPLCHRMRVWYMLSWISSCRCSGSARNTYGTLARNRPAYYSPISDSSASELILSEGYQYGRRRPERFQALVIDGTEIRRDT